MAERKKRKAKKPRGMPPIGDLGGDKLRGKAKSLTIGPETKRDTRFKLGNPGGPGRPKGSRHKLAEAFIHDMYEAWQTSGPSVLLNVIQDEPAAFLRSMVSLMPKEMDVNVNRYDTMTDEQLKSQFLAALREARALGVDFGAGEPASLH